MRRVWGGWRRSAVAAVVLCGVFASGAGLVRAQDGGGAEPVAFCDVVTAAEAQDALGAPVKVTDSGTACSFTAVAGARVQSLTVAAGPPALTAENFADSMSRYAQAANVRLASADVGDAAFATLGTPASQLIARSGDRFVALVLIDARSDDARLALLVDLMRSALARYA
jgi:hypothetical protein